MMAGGMKVMQAERCFVSIMVHLSHITPRDPNFATFRDCLGLVLNDASRGRAVFAPLIDVARELVDATNAAAISGAMDRLRIAVREHYALSAGDAFATWQAMPREND